MLITPAVKKILSYYESDNPGTKANLSSILMNGRLSGTGRMILLAVDQGFEHGPVRSFAANPAAYDPHYHYQFALKAGMNAYAGPLGWLEAGADTFAGQIPTILKMNSSNSLLRKDLAPDQAVTARVSDALRLGCKGIGFTIYPGSDASLDMMEEIRDLAAEAKACGLVVVIWSYARGAISKAGETAIDVISYGAHMAALLGAHIIKVKLPSAHVETEEAKKAYATQGASLDTLEDRVRLVVQSCFQGRRLVIFSGGESKETPALLEEARVIHRAGGSGSIIGRNAFQRPEAEALSVFEEMVSIFGQK